MVFMKTILLLGSTGSIGENTLEIIRRFPEEFQAVALVAGRQWEAVYRQALEFKPSAVVLFDETAAGQLRPLISPIPVYSGMEGILRVIEETDFDYLVNAVVGAVGLLPTYHAIGKARRIALANKETLVMGGTLIRQKLAGSSTELLPIDSEHSAIFQCLDGRRPWVKKIILTASGGPFYFRPELDLNRITPDQALKHPTWRMGAKITIDSASLMNKALEIIEAAFLFDLDPHRIEVVIHPQSYVHSLVEFIDGSQLAQMSRPDMKIPIQYSLFYPDRAASPHINPPLYELGRMEFYQPDLERFPAIRLAWRALEEGQASAVALNAANEVAVDAFLNGKIPFTHIYRLAESAMDRFGRQPIGSLDDLLRMDHDIRRQIVTDLET
ncbi:MAG: 1-deoxy-D-xylulose-5-phosphate reductoisomerase [Candidatus Delongbacteria bacterium]|nr:1-deoxy-D-xylulose-5-phosphate reductoisomerase [Candidatus Delongbacteria bacterium]